MQDVLAGFDDEEVHVSGDQALGLFGEGIAHFVEADVPQRGQLRRRAHGSRHEPGLLRRRVGGGHFACQLRCPLVQLKGLVLDVVLGQDRGGRAKGVGLNDIASGFQKLAMHGLHGIRPGEDQVLVAPFEGQAAEIVGGQIHLLQRSSRCTVEHQHRPLRAVQTLQEANALDGEHQSINRQGARG